MGIFFHDLQHGFRLLFGCGFLSDKQVIWIDLKKDKKKGAHRVMIRWAPFLGEEKKSYLNSALDALLIIQYPCHLKKKRLSIWNKS